MHPTNSTSNIPTGIITFLFTDIEGSTKLWENYPNEMNLALARHDKILRQAIETNSGYIFKTMGDAFYAAFQNPSAALLAALGIQRALITETWPTPSPIKVRIGLHTGEANERNNDYFGPTLNRVARMFAAGHGGQTLLSGATASALLEHDQLPSEVTLQDIGLHHFKDLNQPEQVFQLMAPDLPTEFPPIKSLELALDNLLDQTFSNSSGSNQLIGREQELTDLNVLLSQEAIRLVTLTGIGGTGKTRLSLAVARLMRTQFADGVCFVPLEIITQRQALIKELATTLKIKEVAREQLLDTLKTYLSNKQLLLVLDNFEQLVAQGATLLPELLRAAPKLKIVVTSREVLQLTQEHEYKVQPLAVPQITNSNLLTVTTTAEYTAIALFVARAQAVKFDFRLTEENAPIIAQICHKLDGLPLAIELAAARVKLLSPAKLLERLVDKLKVLTGGARDLPARQQTLRGAIDWSYDLLGPQEQQLFRCLSIFAGGCTIESAEAVFSNVYRRNTSEWTLASIDMLEGLEALSNKSLLKQREDKTGEIRFTMLPTIREYGLEKLATSPLQTSANSELEAVELEYVKYFEQWGVESANKLRGADQVAELARLASEYDNLRESLERTLARPLPAHYALQLAWILQRFWDIRGYFNEGREYLQRSLALTVADGNTKNKAARIKVLNAISRLTFLQWDYSASQTYALEGLALSREISDTRGIATSLYSLARIALEQADYSQAQAYFTGSLDLWQQLADKKEIANSLNSLGGLAIAQKNYRQAQTYYQECLILMQEFGNKSSIASSLNNLGSLAIEQAEYSQAQTYLTESLLLWRELGNSRWVAAILSNMGILATKQGDYPQALSCLEEGLQLRREMGDKWGSSYSLVGFGLLATEQYTHATEPADANSKKKSLLWIACLSGAVATALATLNIKLQPIWASYYEASMEVARTGLGEATFAAEFEIGQALALDAAVDFAFTFLTLSPNHEG
jgi:predicted ATPase/class 3 adenylate cyclase